MCVIYLRLCVCDVSQSMYACNVFQTLSDGAWRSKCVCDGSQSMYVYDGSQMCLRVCMCVWFVLYVYVWCVLECLRVWCVWWRQSMCVCDVFQSMYMCLSCGDRVCMCLMRLFRENVYFGRMILFDVSSCVCVWCVWYVCVWCVYLCVCHVSVWYVSEYVCVWRVKWRQSMYVSDATHSVCMCVMCVMCLRLCLYVCDVSQTVCVWHVSEYVCEWDLTDSVWWSMPQYVCVWCV